MADDDNIKIGPVRDADTGEIQTPASETGSGDGSNELGAENFDDDDISAYDPENDSSGDTDNFESAGPGGGDLTDPEGFEGGKESSTTDKVSTSGSGKKDSFTTEELKEKSKEVKGFDDDLAGLLNSGAVEADRAEKFFEQGRGDPGLRKALTRKQDRDIQQFKDVLRSREPLKDKQKQPKKPEQPRKNNSRNLQTRSEENNDTNILDVEPYSTSNTGLFSSDKQKGVVPGSTDQAEFVPTSEVGPEFFTVSNEFASGTDIPGDSFLKENLPQGKFTLQTRDFKAGEKALATEKTFDDIIGENRAEVARTGTALGLTFAEGVANLPAALQSFARNPKKTAQASVRSLDRTVQPTNSKINTASEIEAQAEKNLLIGGALATAAAPVVAGSQTASLTGITDDAGIVQAGKRATGLDDLKRTGRSAKRLGGKAKQKVIPDSDNRPEDVRIAEEFAGTLQGGDTSAVTDPSDLTGSESSFDTAEPRSFYGEDFQPETPSTKQILSGDTPRATGRKVEVLNPNKAEGIDPVTLTPEGGTEDVTPSLSRREALKTKLGRFGETSRQSAQFKVQDLNDQGGTFSFQDSDSGLFKQRKGSAKVIQKKKPGDIDTGDTTDTSKLIDNQDRRTDVADNQVRFDKDSSVDDLVRRRSRGTRSLDGRSSGLGVAGKASAGSAVSIDTGNKAVDKPVQDESLGDKNPLKDDSKDDVTDKAVEESVITPDNDGKGDVPSTEDNFFKEKRDESRVFRDVDRDTTPEDSFNLQGGDEDEDNKLGSGLFTEKEKDYQASVGAEILGVRAEKKPGRLKAQDPTDLRPIVDEGSEDKGEGVF